MKLPQELLACLFFGFLLAIGLTFAGENEREHQSYNTPTFVLEKDGVKVYRFRDEYGVHYFANAKGEVISRLPKGRSEVIPTTE